MELVEAQSLARQLMDSHRLKGWTFAYDGGERRFGLCSHLKRTISLSRHLTLLNTESTVRNIILHEIAHAKVGPGHGHDRKWKAKAIELGAEPKRCYNNDTIVPKGRYRAICPNCSKEFFRYRRTRSSRLMSCRRCDRNFNYNFLLTFKLITGEE